MEENTKRIIHELDGMIERMKGIGVAAKNLVESVEHNHNVLTQEGGMEGMCSRSMKIADANAAEWSRIQDDYTDAVTETMAQVADAKAIIDDMITAFFRIPEDKKKFASKMN